jgi:long-chain fatty acid transport protein
MRRVFLAVLVSVVVAAPAAAQSNVEVNAGLQFDFLSPGARSLAMGGAFIGNADDATAAFVNPAGLRAISRKEASIEVRGRGFSIPVIVRGHLGDPTFQGVDTISGLQEIEQDQDATGLSFLSFVLPRPRWAIAAYRHELANFETNVVTEGPFFDVDAETVRRRLPIRGAMDLNITTYGASGSFNVTPEFSVGGGVAVYDFGMDSRTDRYSITGTKFYEAADYSAANLANYQNQIGDDTAVGVNVGALFAPNRKFQVGVVFRQGPEFDLQVTNNDARTNQPFPDRDRAGQFNVPHVFGVGTAIRPITNLTIAADVSRVGYSRLTDGFVDIFNTAGSATDESAFYAIDDATELHTGAEYVFGSQVPIAVRVGYWLDPAHSLVYTGASISEQQVFKNHDDQHHFTFGGGAVFGRFEINAGGDVADRTTIFSVSGVVRF